MKIYECYHYSLHRPVQYTGPTSSVGTLHDCVAQLRLLAAHEYSSLTADSLKCKFGINQEIMFEGRQGLNAVLN
jgi:hypothetical protein